MWDELSKNYPNIISVDVGDHIQGGTLGSISDGTAIIDIMNKVGFDVSILGNHEFDYGIEQLSKFGENITSKYISTNFCYRANKTSVCNPYKIINQVRNVEGADYVILLTHVGMNAEQYTRNILLSKIQNVDAVLDGHTHQIYNTTSKDMDNKDIHITQTGTKLQSIGKLVIKKDGTIESENIQDIPEPSDKTNATKLTRGKKEVWVNKEMNDYINNMFSLYEKDLNELYGSNDYDLLIMPEGVTDSHSAYCRFQECIVIFLLTLLDQQEIQMHLL